MHEHASTWWNISQQQMFSVDTERPAIFNASLKCVLEKQDISRLEPLIREIGRTVIFYKLIHPVALS
jgi:hypothetical protein